MNYNDIVTIIMMLLIFVFFYATVIMPHKKREKQTQEMQSGLKVGDKIVTFAGMIGKIVNINDDNLTIEAKPEKIKISILRWAVKEVVDNNK